MVRAPSSPILQKESGHYETDRPPRDVPVQASIYGRAVEIDSIKYLSNTTFRQKQAEGIVWVPGKRMKAASVDFTGNTRHIYPGRPFDHRQGPRHLNIEEVGYVIFYFPFFMPKAGCPGIIVNKRQERSKSCVVL